MCPKQHNIRSNPKKNKKPDASNSEKGQRQGNEGGLAMREEEPKEISGSNPKAKPGKMKKKARRITLDDAREIAARNHEISHSTGTLKCLRELEQGNTYRTYSDRHLEKGNPPRSLEPPRGSLADNREFFKTNKLRGRFDPEEAEAYIRANPHLFKD